MTLGEKIKEARKQCCLSQEQLAEKMAVSRSAVAKWEANNGLPDVDNLKALAGFLNVSIDYLLDDGEVIDELVMREHYNLSDYGKGIKKKKKDRVIREKFPDAEIHTLLGKLKLTKSEKVIDNLLGFFTDAPFGIPELINSFKNMIWGIVLIAAGALFALNALNITDIDIFFDGWWTLFIIVPCAIGLFTEREKTGNIIGIAVGVFLLLCCQDILSFSMLWKLLVPAIIVIVGLKMVFTGLFGNKANEIIAKIKQNGGETKVGCATFSGCELNYDGEVFEGAELTAVFGGVDCDLKNAIIEKDCAIQVSAIFGGIDILVPDNVNVKVSSNCIFGGISNKTAVHKEAPTIYVSGTCMFGGVEIK